MFPDNTCPLCPRTARINLFNGIDARVQCDQCGNFKVTGRLYDTVLSPGSSVHMDAKGLLPYLSAHTRQANERGEEVFLDNGNWKEFAFAHKNISVARKLTKFLEFIAENTKPGEYLEIKYYKNGPLLDASGAEELSFLGQSLVASGFVERHLTNPTLFRMCAKGWEAIQASSIGGVSGRCFVAMSFDKSLDEAYDKGIYLAVKNDCKMEPVRVDREEYNEDICDKIIAEIRTCQFVVADFTDQKHGVYFEAGFAMGLGRPVIWTCQENDFKNVHFDTRQYNHIVWKNPTELREKLTNRIKATIPGAG